MSRAGRAACLLGVIRRPGDSRSVARPRGQKWSQVPWAVRLSGDAPCAATGRRPGWPGWLGMRQCQAVRQRHSTPVRTQAVRLEKSCFRQIGRKARGNLETGWGGWGKHHASGLSNHKCHFPPIGANGAPAPKWCVAVGAGPAGLAPGFNHFSPLRDPAWPTPQRPQPSPRHDVLPRQVIDRQLMADGRREHCLGAALLRAGGRHTGGTIGGTLRCSAP